MLSKKADFTFFLKDKTKLLQIVGLSCHFIERFYFPSLPTGLEKKHKGAQHGVGAMSVFIGLKGTVGISIIQSITILFEL